MGSVELRVLCEWIDHMERGDRNSGLTDINGNQLHMASTEIGNLSVTVLEVQTVDHYSHLRV